LALISGGSERGNPRYSNFGEIYGFWHKKGDEIWMISGREQQTVVAVAHAKYLSLIGEGVWV